MCPPKSEPEFNTGKDVRKELSDYIKEIGLLPYKDFYMRCKNSIAIKLPDGINKDQFLMIARDVYESRASFLDRKSGNKKAIRFNRHKK
ncbi:hypothetical protein [Mucilaginibacter sp.]|uniref:hypothetical protein n=1 Tax=Mucilaginibacter sp. TaxID=1882438 RepID=UPI00262B79C7|nr:hypothetical protein [Mucilaginibacter sp.]